jgi:hypothetical protein
VENLWNQGFAAGIGCKLLIADILFVKSLE